MRSKSTTPTPGQSRVLDMLRFRGSLTIHEIADSFPSPIADSDAGVYVRTLVACGLVRKTDQLAGAGNRRGAVYEIVERTKRPPP